MNIWRRWEWWFDVVLGWLFWDVEYVKRGSVVVNDGVVWGDESGLYLNGSLIVVVDDVNHDRSDVIGELLIVVGDKNVEANVEFVKWDEVEYIGVGWDVVWLIILYNSPSGEWCMNDGEGGLSWELISDIVEIFIEEISLSFWWADVEFVIWVLRSVMFDVSSVGVYSYAFCSGWNQSKAGPEYKPTSYRKYGYGQRVILYLSFIYVCANIESNKISCTDY